MKKTKIFSLLLCAAALLSPVTASADDAAVAVLDTSQIFMAEPGEEPRRIADASDSLRMTVKPGATLYFSIANAVRAEDLTGLRVVTNWSKGEELTDAPRIEYRQMMNETGTEVLGYRYVVALNILPPSIDQAQTLRGTIKLAQRANARAPTVSFILSVRQDGRDGGESIICRSRTLLTDFSGIAGSITVNFYDDAFFEVDATGQGPLDLGCSTLTVTNIAERYRGARLQFLTWSKRPFFNRAGKLSIDAAPGTFLYELQGDNLVDRSESYSENAHAFVLTTRRLEGFVVSDIALDSDAQPVPEPNPPTGALAL